jgi:serine/threonine protein phosphatase 1
VARLAIVGDIHGDARALDRLLPRIAGDQRTIIFIGDLINRGPDSRSVVGTVLDLRRERSVEVLLGNHEASLLRYLQTGRLLDFALKGGLPTIRSYAGEVSGDVRTALERSIPSAHMSLFHEARVCWEDEDVILAHAGVPPANPSSRLAEEVVDGSHPDLFVRGWPGPRLLVCGHYVQRSGKPFVGANFICLDTGCGSQGRGVLTALLLPEKEFVTSR